MSHVGLILTVLSGHDATAVATVKVTDADEVMQVVVEAGVADTNAVEFVAYKLSKE